VAMEVLAATAMAVEQVLQQAVVAKLAPLDPISN